MSTAVARDRRRADSSQWLVIATLRLPGICLRDGVSKDAHQFPTLLLCLLSFSSVLFTRFILNLRNVGEVQACSGNVSSINFASNVTGNIGAPLEYSEDFASQQSYASTQQQIENPLSIGILNVPTRDMTRYVPGISLSRPRRDEIEHVAVETREGVQVNKFCPMS